MDIGVNMHNVGLDLDVFDTHAIKIILNHHVANVMILLDLADNVCPDSRTSKRFSTDKK